MRKLTTYFSLLFITLSLTAGFCSKKGTVIVQSNMTIPTMEMTLSPIGDDHAVIATGRSASADVAGITYTVFVNGVQIQGPVHLEPLLQNNQTFQHLIPGAINVQEGDQIRFLFQRETEEAAYVGIADEDEISPMVMEEATEQQVVTVSDLITFDTDETEAGDESVESSLVTATSAMEEATVISNGRQLRLASSAITTALEVYDMDNDQDIDIIEEIGLGRILIRLNDGQGHFNQETLFTAEQPMIIGCDCLAIADLDADGDRDIVYGTVDEIAGLQIRVLTNNGTGQLQLDKVYPIDEGAIKKLSVADLNRDGRQDIVVTHREQLTILSYDSARSSLEVSLIRSTPPLSPEGHTALSDMDNDGDQDIVLMTAEENTTVLVFVNNGGWSLTPVETASSVYLYPQALAVADFNNDGYDDVLFGSRRHEGRHAVNPGYRHYSDTILFNQNASLVDTAHQRFPNFSFVTTALHETADLSVGDIDQDGDTDIAIAIENDASRLYLNRGDGSFLEETLSYNNSEGARHIRLADLDRDGDLDIIEAFSDQPPLIRINNSVSQ